ncbi:MAG: sulfotransferase domain-containing protein, partial [Rubrobacter sp.]
FLVEALPESRVVFLVRDPRDVVSSTLNATWIPKSRTGRERRAKRVTQRPDSSVRTRAGGYLQDITHAKQAYDAHGGHKVLVRYEELRADTSETMKRICSTLEIPVRDRKVRRAVKKYSWENLPNAGGRDKGRRKATPGGWREDLTPEQVETVEGITAPVLDEFYPGWKSGRSGSLA